jgi:hypothetical protein
MGWASRKNTETEKEKRAGQADIILVCRSEEIEREYGEFLERTGAMLETVKNFFDACSEIDENKPDFIKKIAPHVERLTIEMILNYPSPNQLVTDLKILQSVRFKK